MESKIVKVPTYYEITWKCKEQESIVIWLKPSLYEFGAFSFRKSEHKISVIEQFEKHDGQMNVWAVLISCYSCETWVLTVSYHFPSNKGLFGHFS